MKEVCSGNGEHPNRFSVGIVTKCVDFRAFTCASSSENKHGAWPCLIGLRRTMLDVGRCVEDRQLYFTRNITTRNPLKLHAPVITGHYFVFTVQSHLRRNVPRQCHSENGQKMSEQAQKMLFPPRIRLMFCS
ncbi:conserved hypothetical protein [Coccidioides posadasii str. Silveira]|uniref:Uncharacterized protein n=1 Tax=Coccidioides posadasii (strain RMSCC 757 / Silveira) TaxID=443226 RepID=E9CXX4_COCPS|nr:conserved hypothetical protein [Coccidioides posadasii str. Silveira]